MVELLIENGAQINTTDRNRNSASYLAQTYGNL